MSRPKSARKKASPKVQSPLAHSAENTHFRLCHFCLSLNESAGAIVQCEGCHHFLTPDVDLIGLSPSHDLVGPEAEAAEDDSAEDEGEPVGRAGFHITGLSVEW